MNFILQVNIGITIRNDTTNMIQFPKTSSALFFTGNCFAADNPKPTLISPSDRIYIITAGSSMTLACCMAPCDSLCEPAEICPEPII